METKILDFVVLFPKNFCHILLMNKIQVCLHMKLLCISYTAHFPMERKSSMELIFIGPSVRIFNVSWMFHKFYGQKLLVIFKDHLLPQFVLHMYQDCFKKGFL